MSFRVRRTSLVGAVLAAAALAGPALADPPARTQPTAEPISLVVLIAVDQMRPDYLDRWKTQLTGGLGRLRGQGVFFTNAVQDHALTETAPGHSTMLSGRVPAHTNIVSNDLGVGDARYPLLEVNPLDANGAPLGASPMRFSGTALFDWMRASDPGTRALSVSRKDRAAILPIGRAKQTVLWYSQGRFTTSRYYADSLPTWVKAFNRTLVMRSWAGRAWRPLLAEGAYTEVDDEPWENGGKDRVFPHLLPTVVADVPAALENVPWMDSLTLAVALRGAREMKLGERSSGADLLSISLSTTDAIGHAFGPDSREMNDQVVRLDRWLGVFLDSLEARVPAGRIVFVLTADHGVAPMPELLAAGGPSASRLSSGMGSAPAGGRINPVPFMDSVRTKLEQRWGTPFGFAFDNGLLEADTLALRARGVNVDSLASWMAAHVAGMEGVRRVLTPRTLAAASMNDDDAGYWRRSLAPGVAWLLAGLPQPGWVFSTGKKAEHGSVNDESRHVPIIVVAPGVAARSDASPARTIDIAPTIARLLGIQPLEALDGRPLPIVP